MLSRLRTWWFGLVVGALALNAGCTASMTPASTSAASAQRQPIALFKPDRAALTVQIIDRRPHHVQTLADADAFNGVLFRLNNPSKLKAARIAASARSGDNLYSAAFTNLPSDAGGNYTLTVGLFRNVGVPANPDDGAYTSFDAKVGEGASGSIALSAGQTRTITVVINAVGDFTLDHPRLVIDPANPSYLSGDPIDGLVDTRVNAAKDPDIASMSIYMLDQASNSANTAISLPREAWPASPATATASFHLPTLPGGVDSDYYHLVIDAFGASNNLISRRSRLVLVERPAIVDLNLDPQPPTLGNFSAVGWTNIGNLRYNFEPVVSGPRVYLLGGNQDQVLHFPIDASGRLGTAVTDAGLTLADKRWGYGYVHTGTRLYLFGGSTFGSATTSVLFSPVASDGQLGPFQPDAGVTMTEPRDAFGFARVHDWVYAFGGNGLLDTVERAPINNDGTLGNFLPVSSVHLTTGNYFLTSQVIGNYLYVLGGYRSGYGGAVERAAIDANGNLGNFSLVDTHLVTGREWQHSAVIGNHVYVFGGFGDPGALNSVERALINPDDSLGAFETVGDVAMLSGRYSFASFRTAHYLYLMGGTDGPNDFSSIEEAPIQ